MARANPTQHGKYSAYCGKLIRPGPVRPSKPHEALVQRSDALDLRQSDEAIDHARVLHDTRGLDPAHLRIGRRIGRRWPDGPDRTFP